MKITALSQAFGLTATLLSPMAAFAETPSQSLYHIYIGAMFSGTDSQRPNVDYGRGFTGAVGLPLRSLSNNLYMEIGGNQQVFKTPDALNSNFFNYIML